MNLQTNKRKYKPDHRLSKITEIVKVKETKLTLNLEDKSSTQNIAINCNINSFNNSFYEVSIQIPRMHN